MTLQSALVVLALAPVLCAASRHGRHHAGQALRSHRHIHRHRHHGHDHRSHESVSRATITATKDQALFAKKLAAVEDDWRSQAVLARECDGAQVDAGKCERLSQSFRESCAAVSGKFVEVSGGSAGQIRHFMELVCGDAAMNDPLRRSQCSSMAGGIVDAKEKSDKDHGSLESKLGAMCDEMWAKMVQTDEAHSAQEQATAPAQAAAEDHASNQSRAAGQEAVSAAAVAPAAAQGEPAGPAPKPKLAAVATRTSIGKAVLVVSDVGSKDDEDQEGGDSDGDAAPGKEAGDSEDEEGDEDDGQKDDSTADDSKQSDTKDGGKDEDADGDEDGDEEGDDNAD